MAHTHTHTNKLTVPTLPQPACLISADTYFISLSVCIVLDHHLFFTAQQCTVSAFITAIYKYLVPYINVIQYKVQGKLHSEIIIFRVSGLFKLLTIIMSNNNSDTLANSTNYHNILKRSKASTL